MGFGGRTSSSIAPAGDSGATALLKPSGGIQSRPLSSGAGGCGAARCNRWLSEFLRAKTYGHVLDAKGCSSCLGGLTFLTSAAIAESKGIFSCHYGCQSLGSGLR